jgi:hypothetical protein
MTSSTTEASCESLLDDNRSSDEDGEIVGLMSRAEAQESQKMAGKQP